MIRIINTPSLILTVYLLACFALWTPLIFWLLSPSRTQLLGTPGWLLVIGTLVIQLGVVVFSFIIRGMAEGWDDEENRTATRVLGWIGYPAAVVWAWWVTVSLLQFGEWDLVVLGALCAAFLFPAVVFPAKYKVRFSAAIVAASTVLIVSGVLTASRLSPILIAPATMYVSLTLLSGMCARFASEVSLSSGRNSLL
ncbi:MAG: hypothetical protein KKF42_07670 [Actinobacteria bacterium]|nr:hypothetical protein [Actinomycetota bacterium]